MKRQWLWCVPVALALAAGCDQSVQNAQQSAVDAVKEAGQEAKAEVEAAGAEAKSAVEGAVADAASLKIGDVDLGKDFTSLIDGLKGTLGEVKDVETAKTALPKLDAANLGLDKLLGFVDQLPAAAKPVLATLLKNSTPSLTEAVQKTLGIPGVAEILKPVLDQIVAKLNKASGGEPAATP